MRKKANYVFEKQRLTTKNIPYAPSEYSTLVILKMYSNLDFRMKSAEIEGITADKVVSRPHLQNSTSKWLFEFFK